MIPQDKKTQAHKISKMLNYIGGTLIFFGLSYLLFNNWDALAIISRILITLGIACWSLIFAASLASKETNTTTSAAFFLLGGLLLPVGISVTLNTLDMPITLEISRIIISGICLSVFLLLQLRFPRTLLLLFCIFFGSSFFVAITRYLNYNLGWFNLTHLFDYQIFILGLFYFILGSISSFRNNSLTGLLHFIGALLILVASFDLGGLLNYNDATSLPWEILAPAFVLMSFILSIPLQSKSLLYLGTIFLVIYIASITHKFAYFFGTIGWPFVLIAAGLGLILLGYLFVFMQKQIPKKN
jgi:hypothetical protein